MIFNAEMVRAILDGRKTQTRRVMKDQPVLNGNFYEVFGAAWSKGMTSIPAVPGHSLSTRCPYGVVGDRIWVRETWARYNIDQDSHDMAYRATTPKDWPKEGCWRPSIHMPRWASRILLEITNIGVQRLNSISQADAAREGLIRLPATGRYCLNQGDQYFGGASHDAREVFSWLWESIYGEDSWQANPWVWVIEFKRIEGDDHATD